jgi:copper chaperone NosL
METLMNITAPAKTGAVMSLAPHMAKAKNMKIFTRILIGLAALALLVILYVPVWRIDLMAPQYPEGLVMQIYIDHFAGDVEKINGLNHYIGMAVIKDAMFPEFIYLPKVVIALCVIGLLVALWGRLSGLLIYILSLSAFGAWALYDMYKWGYDYGHNLDPRAAIKVEGMAYQPPLIGHKQLLNFDAWSTPDTGGWLLFGVMALLIVLFIYEWRRPKKTVTQQ